MIVAESAYLAVTAALLVAALGKLRDVSGFARSVAGYQVLPGTLVRPAAVGVLVAELAAGGLLLATGGRRWGAVVAAVLFAAFLAAMASVMWRRMAVDCGCFGGSDLVGTGTLLRTGLLLVLAVTAALTGPVAFAPVQLPVAAVLFGLAYLPARLLRAERASYGPRPGTRFALNGKPEPAGDRTMYALVSPACGLCKAMLPEFVATADRLDVLLVSAVEGYGGAGLPVVVDPDVFDRNDIPWPPYVVVADRAGTVLSAGGAADPAQLEQVLSRAEAVAPRDGR
ncbi:MauE/DoxX family redox-associated membrane protein [Nonomuraea sp. NPDC050786]|uniref:MauE/DoxX family redox-associated membrane protein n=1 Tax=Nonomuraea sp. NPDC050786 TaxID=3154840 RepID=UPI0033C497AF